MMLTVRIVYVLFLMAFSTSWALSTRVVTAQSAKNADAKPENPSYKNVILVYAIDPGVKDEQLQLEEMVRVLNRRFNPSLFTLRRIKITPTGRRQVTIELGPSDAKRVENAKRLISSSGMLEFRILANETDHAKIVEAARNQDQDELFEDGNMVARWVDVELKHFDLLPGKNGELDEEQIELARSSTKDEVTSKGTTFAHWLTLEPQLIPKRIRSTVILRRNSKGELQTLVLTNPSGNTPGYVLRAKRGKLQTLVLHDGHNVTGQMLESADGTLDEFGHNALSFSFDRRGAKAFAALTTEFSKDIEHRSHRIGIVLDDTLLSAPTLREPITGGQGMISGNFTTEDIDFIEAVLNVISLPNPLVRTPVSEEFVPLEPTVD